MPRLSAPLPAVTTTVSATTVSTPHPTSATPASNQPPTSIEAKLVILGAQGVGKTSLVNRVVNPYVPLPASSQATIGASFITKRIHDPDTNTTVRLQIWDTAGQERFRSISRLYYRGANAGLLCYDVTSEKSWAEMQGWLREMKDNCDFASPENGGIGMVVHIVGTKTDLVAVNPDTRQVPFERTISFAAEHLSGTTNLPPSSSQSATPSLFTNPAEAVQAALHNPESKRNSGFWNSDLGWDSCHEVSAKDNDGIEEVFRVIARKLVEQRNRKDALEAAQTPAWSADQNPNSGGDYFAGARYQSPGGAASNTGSFRLGYGDRRKSWLGLPTMGGPTDWNTHGVNGQTRFGAKDVEEAKQKGRCC